MTILIVRIACYLYVLNISNNIFPKYQADSVVASYGSATTDDWRTTGVCFDAVDTRITGIRLLFFVPNISVHDDHSSSQLETPINW